MPLNLRPAILGAADGLVSTSGVVAAALGAGGHHFAVARLGLAAAASGTISMANAEFASEGKTDPSAIASMGAGTLAGAAIPMIPLLVLGGMYGILSVCCVALIVAGVVAVVRGRVNGRSLRRNVTTTAVGLLLGVLVGLAVGS